LSGRLISGCALRASQTQQQQHLCDDKIDEYEGHQDKQRDLQRLPQLGDQKRGDQRQGVLRRHPLQLDEEPELTRIRVAREELHEQGLEDTRELGAWPSGQALDSSGHLERLETRSGDRPHHDRGDRKTQREHGAPRATATLPPDPTRSADSTTLAFVKAVHVIASSGAAVNAAQAAIPGGSSGPMGNLPIAVHGLVGPRWQLSELGQQLRRSARPGAHEEASPLELDHVQPMP
jgi:hypothetical protein